MTKFLLGLLLWAAIGGGCGIGYCFYMEPRYTEVAPGTWNLLMLVFGPLGTLLGMLVGIQFFIQEPEE